MTTYAQRVKALLADYGYRRADFRVVTVDNNTGAVVFARKSADLAGAAHSLRLSGLPVDRSVGHLTVGGTR